jgi:N-acetylglutamate synthase-like GNAT family acetyltransferase
MGIGASAVKDLIMLLKGKIRCREIRTSYAEGNYGAARFFEELGFIPISEPIDREIVARYEGNLHI